MIRWLHWLFSRRVDSDPRPMLCGPMLIHIYFRCARSDATRLFAAMEIAAESSRTSYWRAPREGAAFGAATPTTLANGGGDTALRGSPTGICDLKH